MYLPKRVHAVKIRYREQVLRKLPHGRFGMYKGKKCVYISYLPGKANVTGRTQERHFLDSAKGREFAPQIKKYLAVRAEFDKLLAEWRAEYASDPPMVKFPIVQPFDPQHLDNKFFQNAEANANTKKNDHPVYSDDDVLRSKNEQFGKGVFKKLGIPYKYEAALAVNNPAGYVPDYLLSFYEIDRCIYAEICGMSDDYDYSTTIAKKLSFYSKNQYRPGREIVYGFMYDKYNFDEEYFAWQVLSAFDTLIPESALDWENCLPPRITGE